MAASKYDKRGVSADKAEVHAAVKNLDKGIYPNSFCRVLPDLLAADPLYCNVMHADTAGSKSSLAWIYWKESGENIWKGLMQDAIVMNLDDLFCLGNLQEIIFSSTIGRNKKLIPGEVISQLIAGSEAFMQQLRDLGIGAQLAGGETADVGDIVRTLDVGFTAFTRLARDKVIEIDIKEGDVIVGLASFGQASYEAEYNSGIGSNGLTSARHDVLNSSVAELYPESFSPEIDPAYVYTGSRNLLDIEDESGISVGKLLLSPTRTYAPVLKKIFESIPDYAQTLSGFIHCTGGGQCKVMNFVDKNLHIIKDNLFTPPPVFELIHTESKTTYKEMYQVFNMGHRMECYTAPAYAEQIIEIAESFQIEARIIGRCEKADGARLSIDTPEGTVEF